jgi:predicted MFS family arabinose efflux permease
MRTLVHDSPSLAGVVAVTAVMNFCYFPLFSTIPLLADRFHIGAAQLGVLGACPGVGMMSSAAIASWRTPRRPARTYLAGCLLAFLGLLAASQANTVSTTALALLVSGLGAGLFAAFQASLVIRSVRSELRGRAMGVMNTAIGCMTGGLLLGGYIASAYGVSTAIAILALVGLTVLSGCSTAWWHVWTSM